jgi:PD-(D/E)XK nuclease superfamily
MIFSYTQISRYLSCPRSYRHRYIEGWQEKELRAQLAFGRAFESALGAYFRGKDCVAALHEAWAEQRDAAMTYGARDTWDRMLHQGIVLLHLFAQERRVWVPEPEANLQVKCTRAIDEEDEFVAYVDAIGELDGHRCIIDWKTTNARYAEEPHGLLSLDPQLTCYSWMTGIEEAALVVFVRKSQPEIQYLRTKITEEHRSEYFGLVRQTVNQIKAWSFPLRPGIRFPNNGCVSCPYLGLCLNDAELLKNTLFRDPGANLAWLDELSH